MKWREKLEDVWAEGWLAACVGGLLYLAVNYWLPWPPYLEMALCLGAGTALVYGGFGALGQHYRKLNTPLRTEHHPLLGEVTYFKERWEAKLPGESWEVAGELNEAGQMMPAQITLAEGILARLPELLEESRTSLILNHRESRGGKDNLGAEEIVLDVISLTDETAFTLLFEVPGRKEYPDGAYVDYDSFMIEEYGVVH